MIGPFMLGRVGVTTSPARQISAPPLALRRLARRRVSLSAVLFVTLFGLAVVVSPAAGRAQDEVDIAFTVLSPALVAAGVGPTEQAFAKGLVQCAIAPRATPLGCARDALIRTLPPGARGLAECIARESQPARCAANQALSEAQRLAFDTVNRLGADARYNPGAGGTLVSLIKVAQGIRDNDWVKVSAYGGKEAAKVAAKILYKALLPPLAPLAPLLDPAIAAAIDVRADLVTRLIDAARRVDEAGVVEAAAALGAHSIIPVNEVCAALPSSRHKDRICARANEIIGRTAEDVGAFYDAVSHGDVPEAVRVANCFQPRLVGRITNFLTGFDIVQDTPLSDLCPDDRPPPPPPRKTDEQCNEYARQAMADQERNLHQQCGRVGNRWQGDHAAHYNWCRSADARLVDREAKARTDRLNQCTGCGDYARQAVASQQLNMKQQCRLSGPRWQANETAHFNWCMSADPGSVDRESRARTDGLNQCTGCDNYARAARRQILAAASCLDVKTVVDTSRWGLESDHFGF